MGQEFGDGSAGPCLPGVFHVVAVICQTAEHQQGGLARVPGWYCWLLAGRSMRWPSSTPTFGLYSQSKGNRTPCMVAGSPRSDVSGEPVTASLCGNKVNKFWHVLKTTVLSAWLLIIVFPPLAKCAHSFPSLPKSHPLGYNSLAIIPPTLKILELILELKGKLSALDTPNI